jgi:hypothetical protein
MDPTIPEPPESPRLLRPRTVGEILTDAFELYRRHWQNLFVIVAVIVIPLSFAQVLVGQVWIHQGLTEEELRNGVEVTVNGGFVAGVFASLVVAMASILMWTVLTGAITRAAAGTFLGRDLEIGESYRYGFARFWSIVLVAVLSALVIEGTRGRQALRRSWNLVRGRGWPVFGTIIVAIVLTSLVNSLLTSPFGDNWAARSIGASIASILTMPYMALVGVFIYLDLRVRKEQYSAAELERDLASSGAEPR